MSDNDRERDAGEGAAIGNVPLRDQGGPTGSELGTTGGGGEGTPGNVLGASGGVGGQPRTRKNPDSQPEGRGDRSRS